MIALLIIMMMIISMVFGRKYKQFDSAGVESTRRGGRK